MTFAVAPFVSATKVVEALADREVSSVELVDTAIARIELVDSDINAVVVRDFDRARAAAKASDEALGRGERRPLLGLPMTLKEAVNVAGLQTTWGVAQFKGWVPERDTLAVARLKAAGAVIIGKTNIAPWLADWQSDNPVYGRTNNPYDLARTPGARPAAPRQRSRRGLRRWSSARTSPARCAFLPRTAASTLTSRATDLYRCVASRHRQSTGRRSRSPCWVRWRVPRRTSR